MANEHERDAHNDRTMVERVDPLMGSTLDDRYSIDFRLAAGGFGAIYRATHLETGNQVALKVLLGQAVTSDPRVVERFRREGETLAQLRDEHTIAAYEVGEAPDGSLYIVMELLHGESLYEQFRSRGALPWRRVASIGAQVCSSLSEAHALGIIHRDLKPANIHLEHRNGNPDFVKVLDFGIAKIIADGGLDATELTQAGQMIGTFDYMAPEQMVGGQCTPATDIYTLGIVLYEMVTGRRPFAGASSPTAMLAALLTENPPALDVPGVPPELERILFKCLEREPQNRYETADELAADLDRLVPSATATVKLMTPAPILADEETVVAQPRPRPASQPPRAKRDSSPPNANVIRRGDSQKVPVVKPAPSRSDSVDPQAWQSLQLPKRDRESQQVPTVHRDTRRAARDSQSVPTAHRASHPAIRDSQPVPVARRDHGSQPVPVLPTPQAVVDRPSQPVPTPYHGAGSAGVPLPQHDVGSAGVPMMPTTLPGPPMPQASGYPHPEAHGLPTPTPTPFRPTPTPTPTPHPFAPPGANWHPGYPQAEQRSGMSYDMAGQHSRDVVVRRVVWALALILGVILVIVVAGRL